jgi:hypothetical protein
MLRIIVITLTFAVLWSIRWFWLAGPNQAVIENWVKGGAGIATYADIRQVGFPNRYDVTLNDLRIAKNDLEIFETDVLQVMRLAYRQDHFVLAFSNDIKIVGQTITASKNRASIVKQENDVQRVVWEANDIALDNGATIKHGQLAIIVPPNDPEITLYLQLSEIAQNGMVVHENAKQQIKVLMHSPPDTSTLAKFVTSLETGFISAEISNPDDAEQMKQLTEFRNFGGIISIFPALATLLN